MIEQVSSVPITGSVILRAIRAYSCLTKHGDWIEPPRRVIVNRYRHSPSPVSSLQRQEAQAAKAPLSRKTRPRGSRG